MNKICTSIEQSKKLIELGIDITTVDMYYLYDYNIKEYDDDTQIIPQSELEQHFSLFPEDIPAWSLSALLDLMPKVNGHYPELCRGKQTGQYYMWIEDTFDTQTFNNPIDAAFEMIVWLKENGKI
jgi:hypothetical protein